MSKPLRTNPAYAHLAYRKTIVNREIVFLRRTYLGDELTSPREVLVCEEVFPQDQQVPQEEVQHRIETLTEEAAKLDVELRKFQLVAPTTQGRNEQSRSKEAGFQHSKGRQRNRKGGRPN